MSKELIFLESLAFHAMKNNTIILRPNLVKKALNEAKVSLLDHRHILNIGILKSFNKQGIDTQIETCKDHYFVHLSFQDYFAARYLMNALNGSLDQKTIAIDFIKTQKYNQRHALVFTFLSGLCSENDSNTCLNTFWKTILTSSLDLVGIRHIQLVISCIEETSSLSTIPWHSELLAWIAKCIEYNLSTQNEIILSHLLQSLQKAQTVVSDQTLINVFTNLLQNEDLGTKNEVSSFIFGLINSNPSAALITLVTNALDNKTEWVRKCACNALGKIGEKAVTNEIITKLLSTLGSENYRVRTSACEALGNIGKKAATYEVIIKLLYALENENEDVRSSSCEILGKIGEKAATNEVIIKLVSALGDKSEGVRSSACEALGNIGEKSVTNEVITKLLSALGDESNDVRSSACQALGNIGENVAMVEVITRLVSALGDESKDVRSSACTALGNIGEKAVTNEVITKLISVLGDVSQYVRWCSCEALGKIGKKAATNEVITKLVSALENEMNMSDKVSVKHSVT